MKYTAIYLTVCFIGLLAGCGFARLLEVLSGINSSLAAGVVAGLIAFQAPSVARKLLA